MRSVWRALFGAVLVLGFVTAGCVGAESAETYATPSTIAPAPEPTTSADTGSITGSVLSEDLSPIQGATIAIIETNSEAKSDANGTFTFNDLPAGSFGVIANALGYEPVSKRLDVVPGEVAEAKFILKAIEIAEAGYTYTMPRTAFIKFGQWTVQYTQHMVNQSGVNEQLCEPCTFNLPLVPNIKAAMIEVDFVPSTGVPPVVNYEIGIGVIKDYVQGSGGSYIVLTYFKPRTVYNWPEATVKQLKGEESVRLQVHGPGPGNPGIAFQQRVDTYSSFSVNEEFPETFTALPPK